MILLTLAEYAGVNTDGTYNVIRGGIDLWRTKGFPFDFAAFLLVEVPPGAVEAGTHQFKISVRDGSGARVCDIDGSAQHRKPEDRVRAALGLVGPVTCAGKLTIDVTLGALETTRYVVNVVEESGA